MAKTPNQIFPVPELLLKMESEEIAGFLLEYLNEFPLQSNMLNLQNLMGDMGPFASYAGPLFRQVTAVVAEAWGWLLSQGMIAPQPDSIGHGFVLVTRRGRAVRSYSDLEAYRKSLLLHEEGLDVRLAQKVIAPFRQGDYDTAVFIAFKEVEVRVREAGGYPHGEIGVALMQKALHFESGPLTDMTRQPAERQAMMFLFAGAIGMFKNPSSHRNVEFNAAEAAPLIHFANYLLTVSRESQTEPRLIVASPPTHIWMTHTCGTGIRQ
jgi:uncharacterized protein (TIGR02391 family)